MLASELYKELIKKISLLLKEESFSRKGNCFYLRQGKNWGLIDFQKSRKSFVDEMIFTINVGICSGNLLEFFSPELSNKKPSIEVCQWRQRLGFLLPSHQDKWWIVREEVLDLLIDELTDYLLKIVIPKIKEHIEDKQLCNEWFTGKSPGLTDIQRLMNLSVLLKIVGVHHLLNSILEELKGKASGKPTSFMVKQHLKNLQQVIPNDQ